MKPQPGLVGGLVLICIELIGVAIVLGLRQLEGNWAIGATFATLPLLIGAFLYFLASFSGEEGRRPYVVVLLFIVVSLGSIILLFAILYTWAGIIYGNDDTHPISQLFPECVYFSVVTLTTVGYGDFHPLSLAARWVAGIEALSGYIILGVLVSALVNILRPHRLN